MAVTVEQLQQYVGTSESGDFIQSCLDQGTVLVERFIGSKPVPEVTRDGAVLLCASELFHRRSAPNGVTQFADFSGQAIRVARDPMTSVYPMLLPFVGYAR
jgi:hypothetical protein